MKSKKNIIVVLGVVLLAGVIFIFTQKPKDQPNKSVVKPPASQIVRMTKDSVHVRQPDGKIEAKFYSEPINYQDENGNWHPIDTTLKFKGDIYRGDGTKVSVGKDGTVRVDGMNLTQKTSRIGYLNSDTQNFTPLIELKDGKIKENKFIRETGGFRHELTLSEKGLKEELILSEKPTGWQSGDSLVIETQVSGMDLPQGWLEKDLKVGDLIFPAPTSEDARHVKGETKRFAKEISGKQYLYTGVPASWLAKAVYPVIIDPDFAESTDDGFVVGTSGVYSTARSTSTSVTVSGGVIYVGQDWVNFGSDMFSVYRSALKFDTSSIGASSTVTQVNLKLSAGSNLSISDFDVQIVGQDWSGQDPLTSGNMETFYDNCLSGTADSGSPWQNTSGVSVNTMYTSPDLSTSWVSKTGNTYYCLRSSRDYSNTAPPGIDQHEYITINTAEHSNSSLRPVLVVLYVTPPSTPDMTAGTDSGSSSTDNITSDTTPTFTISCETGLTVTLYDNTTSVGSNTCAGGTIDITSSALSETTHASMNAKQGVSDASENLSITIDGTAPTNQDTVFAASTAKPGGAAVTVVSSGDATNAIWFAPSGTTSFSAGSTMTTAGGTATSILAPATAGSYKMFVIDAAGNYSAASTATLTVDNTAPTNQDTVFAASIPKQGGAAVTVVSSGDAANAIWFAPSGTTSFSAGATMTTAGGTATSILAPATEGSYKMFVLDAAGNYSAASTATLTVDNTAPTTPGTPSTTTPNTDTTPTFRWGGSTDTGGSGLDYYSVDWSKDSGFSSGVTSSTSTTVSCSLSTTTCGGASGLSSGTWYVRIKAFDVAGNSSSFSANGSAEIITTTLNFQGLDMQGIEIR